MSMNVEVLQYLEDEEWRVLTSIEMGQRNHELVATELIHSIAGLRGSIHHHLSSLLRHRLISHEGKPYDGYQLTKAGYDYLALHTLVKRGTITTMGPLLGQGKEADVYVAYDEDDQPVVLKFHRIGRVSFRKAKDTRDYLNGKHTRSWLYLSRLSAQREFNNLLALQSFPVPRAIDSNRHCTVMSLIPGTLLSNAMELTDPLHTFNEIVDLAVSLLKIGVVHADFSEFNVIISDDEKVTLIDFPQCMPYTLPEAEEKFNHDIAELRRFFELRFDLKVDTAPTFADILPEVQPIDLYAKRTLESINEEEDNEEEDESGVPSDRTVQARVSKEKKYKRRIRKRNPIKEMSKLRLEAKSYNKDF